MPTYTQRDIDLKALELADRGASPEQVDAFRQEASRSLVASSPAFTAANVDAKAQALLRNGASEAEVDAFRKAALDRIPAPPPPAAPPRVGGLPAFDPSMLLDGSGQLMQKPTPEDEAAMRQSAATLTRYGPPAAAAVVAGPPTGFTSFLALSGLLGGTGAASEAAARGIEGKDVLSREGLADEAKAFIQNLPIGPRVRPAVGESPILGSIGTAFKAGAVQGAMATGADAVERSINAGRLESYKSLYDGMTHAGIPATLGFILGGTGAAAMGRLQRRAEMAQRGAELADMGIQKPTLAMQSGSPDMVKWETNVARGDNALAQQISKADSDISNNLREVTFELSKAPQNEALAPALQKYADDAAAVTAKYEEAARKAAESQMKLKLVQENAAKMAPMEAEALRDQASAALLTDLNAQARALYEKNLALGGMRDQSALTSELNGLTEQMREVRSDIAKGMMKAAGIDPTAPLFDKAELIRVATQAMGNRASSPDGKAVIAALEGVGRKIGEIDPQTGKVIEAATYTMDEMRSLREAAVDLFAQGSPNGVVTNSQEKLAQDAYHAITEKTKEVIEKQFPQTYQHYLGMVDFWRGTSEIRDSVIGRAILGKREVDDHLFSAMASSMADGKLNELVGFKSYADLIDKTKGYLGEMTKLNPDIAKVAVQKLADGVRNAILIESRGTAGAPDLRKVYEKVGKLASFAEDGNKFPIPFEQLGFGSPQFVRDFNRVQSSFKPGDVTPAVLADVLSHPKVIQVMESGAIGPEAQKILKTATAEAAFNHVVQTKVANAMISGRSAQQLREAEDAAKRLGIDADAARTAYQNAVNDPVMKALADPQAYQFTKEGSNTGRGSITYLLEQQGPTEAKKIMDHLWSKNPSLAEMIERRLVADKVQPFIKVDRKNPGESTILDLDALQSFFDKDRRHPDAEFLKAALRPEVTKRLEKSMAGLRDYTDAQRVGKFPSDKTLQDIANVGSGLTIVGSKTGSAPGEASVMTAVARRVLGFFSKGAYHAYAATMTNPDTFGFKALSAADGIGEALTSLPASRQFLILSDAMLKDDLQREGAVPPPAPPAAAAAPAPQGPAYEEGRIYRDSSGRRRRYSQGQWVAP